MSVASYVTLVLGGTGRVGRVLCERLEQRSAPARVLTRNLESAAAVLPDSVEVRAGDIAQIGALSGIFDGVSKLFLACGDAPNQSAIEIAAIRAAEHAGVRRVVKLSAHAAGWNPPLSVGVAHHAVEKALRESDMIWTIIRPVFFQQTLLMFSDEIATKGSLTIPMRRGPVSYVDVRDVAAIADHALHDESHAGQIYTATGPAAVDLAELIQIVGALHAREIKHSYLPPWIARLILPFVSGMPRWQSNLIVDLMAKLDKGWESEVTDDVMRVTGNAPRALATTLGELADAFAPRDR